MKRQNRQMYKVYSLESSILSAHYCLYRNSLSIIVHIVHLWRNKFISLHSLLYQYPRIVWWYGSFCRGYERLTIKTPLIHLSFFYLVNEAYNNVCCVKEVIQKNYTTRHIPNVNLSIFER